jgi:hypothetical protein
MMELLTENVQVMADEIARAFRTDPLTRAQLADSGGLAWRLQQAGAVVLKASQYGDRIDLADDVQVLAENTDATFWESRRFLLAPSVSFASGPFRGHCFSLPGPTTASQLLAVYHASVRPVLFDVDTIMLAQSTDQLLIATHYGSVVLLEPSRA